MIEYDSKSDPTCRLPIWKANRAEASLMSMCCHFSLSFVFDRDSFLHLSLDALNLGLELCIDFWYVSLLLVLVLIGLQVLLSDVELWQWEGLPRWGHCFIHPQGRGVAVVLKVRAAIFSPLARGVAKALQIGRVPPTGAIARPHRMHG